MTTVIRYSRFLGSAVALHAIILMATWPVVAALGAVDSSAYSLSQNSSETQLLAEKPGKGSSGASGKGGGNSGNDAGASGKGGGGNSGGKGSKGDETAENWSESDDLQETNYSLADYFLDDEEMVESFLEGTFAEEYFLDNPLKRIQLQRYLIVDEDYYLISSAGSGEKVAIILLFKNMQQKEQAYTLITQIVDQNGITREVGWVVDVVDGGGYVDWLQLWIPDEPGVCTIKVMIWDGIGTNPLPLTEVSMMTVVVRN